MTALITALCIVMIVMAVVLVVLVLMQSGNEDGLSGAIAGSGDSYFGKNKGKTADRILSKVTTVLSIIFVLLVLFVYIVRMRQSDDTLDTASDPTPAVTETATAEETPATAEETPAENAGETESDTADPEN